MLPHFKKYAESGLLDKNQHARNAMVLFYRDILDIHLEMFNFFRKKSKRPEEKGNLVLPSTF